MRKIELIREPIEEYNNKLKAKDTIEIIRTITYKRKPTERELTQIKKYLIKNKGSHCSK